MCELNTHGHNHWRQHHPAYVPKFIHSYAHHLVNAVAELLRPEDPRYGDRLEEANPENRHAARRVEVHQLKYVDSSLKQGQRNENLVNVTKRSAINSVCLFFENIRR